MAPGKFYYIVSRLNGLVLDIANNSDDNRAQVVMWHKNDSKPANQLWYDDLDTKSIRSKKNEKCLTIIDGKLCVDKYDDDNEDQRWVFLPGKGIIKHGEGRDLALDIAGNNKDPGTKVCSWPEHGGANQLWDRERLDSPFFVIRNRATGMVFDVNKGDKDEGTKVVMWKETREDHQLWWEDEYCAIRSKLTGFALATKKPFDKGDEIRCYPFDKSREDMHWIRGRGNVIVNRFRRELALDVEGKGRSKGAEVIIWDRHGEENQQFEFDYV